MLLSVAMIVKNEERYIEKVLQSLSKVKEDIQCEIIVVDTGSEDNTVNICKKYTDKVYFHKWNNNFAHMRNISIQYCTGQWILILDGDEVIENPDELISFFKSGMYKQGNSATVSFKNLISNDDYVLASTFRLFKNDDDFRYDGRVHEQVKMKEPYLKTNISILHYGYLSEDHKLMMYKFKRNYELLEKDLKEKPEDIYTLFQMAQTLSMAKKREESLIYIRKACDIANKRSKTLEYIYIYHFYARELLNLSKYEKCIDVCNKFIALGKEFLDFYCFLVIAYGMLDEDNNVLINGDKYLDIHRNYHTSQQAMDLSTSNFCYGRKDEVLKFMIVSNYKLKNYGSCIKLFESIKRSNYKNQVKKEFINSCLIKNEIQKLKKLYDKDSPIDSDIELLINAIDNTKSVCELKREFYKELLGISNELDYYISLVYFHDKSGKCNIDFKGYFHWKYNILNLLLESSQINIDNLIDLPGNDVYMYISKIASQYDYINKLIEYCRRNFLTQDFKILKFISIIEDVLIKSNIIQEDELRELIYANIINKNILIDTIYNKKVLEDSLDIIDNNKDKFMYKIRQCIKISSENLISSLKELKCAAKYNVNSKCIIDTVQEDLNKNIIDEKMINEKKNLLKIVESLVEKNDLKQAEEILLELDSIFNYDNNILNSLGVVKYMKQDINKALQYLGKAYLVSNKDFETLFNIATVLEQCNRTDDSSSYYRKALEVCNDENIKKYIYEKLK